MVKETYTAKAITSEMDTLDVGRALMPRRGRSRGASASSKSVRGRSMASSHAISSPIDIDETKSDSSISSDDSSSVMSEGTSKSEEALQRESGEREPEHQDIVRLRSDNTMLNSRKQELEQELEEARIDSVGQEARLQNTRELLLNKSEQLTRLETNLERANLQLSDLRNSASETERQLAEARRQTRSDQRHIGDLDETIEARDKEIRIISSNLSAHKSNFEMAKLKISELIQEKDRLNDLQISLGSIDGVEKSLRQIGTHIDMVVNNAKDEEVALIKRGLARLNFLAIVIAILLVTILLGILWIIRIQTEEFTTASGATTTSCQLLTK